MWGGCTALAISLGGRMLKILVILGAVMLLWAVVLFVLFGLPFGEKGKGQR